MESRESSLRVETVTDIRELARLKDAWSRLCEDMGGDVSVFASVEWYECWWRHFSAGATLNVIALWQADRLVGVAPLMVRRATIHGLPVTAVSFIENRQSLHNDFLVLPAVREQFLREMVRCLLREPARWDVVVFRNLPENSASRCTLAGILAETGRTWRQSPTWYDSPYLKPAGSWEEYLAGRSTRTRKSLRHIRNGFARAGYDVSVRNIRTWEEFLAVRDEVLAVAKQSWAEQSGDSLASPANEAFINDLAFSAAQKGWLSLWTLALNGRMIAIEFHLRAFGREHALRGHYLPEFAALSPGTYLESEILRQIFGESPTVQVYDFCGSFESYKRKWTDSFVPHCDLTLFGKRSRGRCLAFHEIIVVPLLKRMFPKDFWNCRLFGLLGISTRRMDTEG